MGLKAISDITRRKEFNRGVRSLRYLAHRLGYDWNPEAQQGVTDHFHGPMCERMDRLRHHPKVATFAQRKGLKSTLFTVCLAVQEVMRNPDVTIMVNHAVEAESNKLVQEIGDLFRMNEWLRDLDPMGVYPVGHKFEGRAFNLCPHHSHKKWISSSPSTHFTITRRPRMNPTTRRQYTVMSKGAGSETTGVHVDIIMLDDIIGLMTLEDSTGMAKIRKWYQVTVESVLNNNGRMRLVGTRYDENDFYATNVIGNSEWDVLIRSARENESGEMDWKGRPTHWGPAITPKGRLSDRYGKILAEKRERSALINQGEQDYAAQRMNDPTPKGAIPWVTANERYCGLGPRGDGFPGADNLKGTIFVLSDPAPRAGSSPQGKERQRGDGSKDWWSIAVVKLAIHEMLKVIILLDGVHSQNWNRPEGLRQAAILMKKWGTPYFFNENYTGGQGDYTDEMRMACSALGTPLYLAEGQLPKYKSSYQSGAKNSRFVALAGRNDVGEFYICDESCPQEFLHGDERKTGFLTQIRKLRPLPTGRNNLPWDDDADSVARATDPALVEFAPVVSSRSRMDAMREREQVRRLIKRGSSRVRHIYIPG